MAELIVALDVNSQPKALEIAATLHGSVSWFKVGLELFITAGPEIVTTLKEMGFKVFLDLKFYDIPNTVAKAVQAACHLNVDLLTLHCQGGRRMCEAAVNAVADFEQAPLLFGVTALTSFADKEMPGINVAPGEFAISLAEKAGQWGLNGVVCSANEVKNIKENNPSLLCLCPGIRPAGYAGDDQRRTMTPSEAVIAGADFLVVGRPIIQAEDPGQAAREISAQIH